MRRVLVGVMAAMAFASAALPAQAAEVSRSRFKGHITWAQWDSAGSSSYITLMQSTGGEGVVTVTVLDGWPCDVPEPTCDRSYGETTDFTYSVAEDLSTATLTASVPATTCGPAVGCFEETLALNVTWTAVGDLVRESFKDHVNDAGFIDVHHSISVSRPAVASGTIGDTAWSEEVSTDHGTFIAKVKRGTVSICVPC